MTLRICSYNIHKGFSQFNRRMVVHELRDRLRTLDSDLVFLQEVQGLHLAHPERHPNWPALPQHEFLAEEAWHQTAYGGNAVYDHGHHGNAILSRHAILSQANQDVSDHRFERRGLLHCEIQLPGFDVPVHCVCVHLGLIGGSRRRQMEALAERKALRSSSPATSTTGATAPTTCSRIASDSPRPSAAGAGGRRAAIRARCPSSVSTASTCAAFA
jgi:endonuclease/exonuclease/phosphatase family metal-dependent hydrolase